MGIDVAPFRVDRRGTSPRHRRFELLDVYIDRDEEFTRACVGSNLPVLTRAKPYGSVVLLPEEMDQFAEELRTSAGSGRPGFLASILVLADRCASDRSTELHLDGD
ncbi:hypothetical protein [Promicromonospora sukumoe]|uniref:hypothetical protein n=1 Tax=Promicromonospora sukumoe TaxID=88382 RepID=UPI0003639371|nr:hypothetical protein [Promicromonospora sukumoe]